MRKSTREESPIATRPPAAKPDLTIDDVRGLAPPVVVKELGHTLGLKLVAYISGAVAVKDVAKWIEGTSDPTPLEIDRMRWSLVLARIIVEHDSPRVAQAWFQGLNPRLNDRSPARLLREGRPDEIGPQVIDAARAFVIGA